ncbi:MAG: hypothetical protein ACRED9_13310 [Caulobacteraceae bacterium]
MAADDDAAARDLARQRLLESPHHRSIEVRRDDKLVERLIHPHR